MITFQIRNKNPEDISNKILAKAYFDMIMATKLELEDINPQFSITHINQENGFPEVIVGVTHIISNFASEKKQQKIVQWIKSLQFSTAFGVLTFVENDLTSGIWMIDLQDVAGVIPSSHSHFSPMSNEISSIVNWGKADSIGISYAPGYSSIGIFMSINIAGPQAKDPDKMKDELERLIYSK